MDLLSLADASFLLQEPFVESTTMILPPASEESASNQSSDPPPQKDSLLLERVGGGGDPIGPRKRSRRGPAPRTPQQQARSVARRNARERKRVRLVNLGFANLRDHIPPHLGSASASPKSSPKTSSSSKKLSKVETLRCAIEYIKQLREAIGFEDSGGTSEGFSSPPDLSSSPSYCTTPSPVAMLMSRSPPMFQEENDDFLDMLDWTTL